MSTITSILLVCEVLNGLAPSNLSSEFRLVGKLHVLKHLDTSALLVMSL